LEQACAAVLRYAVTSHGNSVLCSSFRLFPSPQPQETAAALEASLQISKYPVLHWLNYLQEKFLPNRSVREMVSYYYNVWKIRWGS
jgi:hypothetical protein